jgi:hypothetical protein
VLGLVDNVLVVVEPILTLVSGSFAFEAQLPGPGTARLHYDGAPVEIGRTFYCMAKEGEVVLNHRTGKFSLGKGASATFRCVWSGQHQDVEVKRGA